LILYLDSSAVLSIYLNEGSRPPLVRAAIADARLTFVSSLGHVEVHAGLARARFKENPPRLSASAYSRAVTSLDDDWNSFFQTDVSIDLIRAGGALAERHHLRAYDAVHLASALIINERSPDTLILSTWDRELAAAAEAEGLSLAHEVTN
jgi:predicted nucleic acid-binding protein